MSKPQVTAMDLCEAMTDRLKHYPYLTAKNLARTFHIPKKVVVFVINTFADDVETFSRTPASKDKRPAFRMVATRPADRIA